jgi:hypothetical protein
VTAEAQYWKSKYFSVVEEQKREVEHREKFKQIIMLLEKKLELVTTKDTKSPRNTELEAECCNLKKILELYEILTSMSIILKGKKEVNESSSSSSAKKKINPDAYEFICTLKNKILRLATRFHLITRPDEFEYIPKVNPDMLPDYLKNSLTFPPDAATVMLSDMLAKLFDGVADE